jgi:ABC-type sugar transport system ATPase subunit
VARVSLSDITKFFGSVQALADVSLEIADGEFVVFVGPSGCGKSTLLRAIAGLEDTSKGCIMIGETDVTDAAPSDRDVSMVFQSYALYPHMTVRENMEFGMKIGGVRVDERGRRVVEAARILQLDDLLERRPSQLSGGQRQRVAIGRAIVKQPKVFLFDEPLSNLDAKLRIQMRVELSTLHHQLGATMVYVTHDQVEAMTMADKIVVLNKGRVEQVGTPHDLYHKPATEFVAGFIGSPSMNFLGVSDKNGNVDYAGIFMMRREGERSAARLGIRPEHIQITPPGEGTLDAEVTVRESLGSESFLYLKTFADDKLVIKTEGESPLEPNQTVGLSFPFDRLHFFDADGITL